MHVICSRIGIRTLTSPACIKGTPPQALRAGGALGSRLVNTKAASADAKTLVTEPAAPENQSPMAPQSNSKDDVKGDMLKPSVVNTSWVRTAAMVGAVAAAAGSSAVLPARLNAFMHVLAYGVWLGSNIWNTFFVGLTMFKNMPRQMFGRVQSHLFPKYFALTTACNVLVLGSLVLGTSGPVPVAATVTLGAALAASLFNAVWLEPIATKLMFQRYDIENKADKTEEDKTQIAVLYKQFGKWHGISSLLNLIITCAALSHGWYLAGAVTL